MICVHATMDILGYQPRDAEVFTRAEDYSRLWELFFSRKVIRVRFPEYYPDRQTFLEEYDLQDEGDIEYVSFREAEWHRYFKAADNNCFLKMSNIMSPTVVQDKYALQQRRFSSLFPSLALKGMSTGAGLKSHQGVSFLKRKGELVKSPRLIKERFLGRSRRICTVVRNVQGVKSVISLLDLIKRYELKDVSVDVIVRSGCSFSDINLFKTVLENVEVWYSSFKYDFINISVMDVVEIDKVFGLFSNMTHFYAAVDDDVELMAMFVNVYGKTPLNFGDYDEDKKTSLLREYDTLSNLAWVAAV